MIQEVKGQTALMALWSVNVHVYMCWMLEQNERGGISQLYSCCLLIKLPRE